MSKPSFPSIRCNKCHALTEEKRDVTYFMDNDFHNRIGIIRHDVVALACKAEALINSGNTTAIDHAAIRTNMSALGRFLITKKDADIASFKTPDLRNVLITAPYFHDGSQRTLWDVMDHYNKGDGIKNPYLDEDMQPLALRGRDRRRRRFPGDVHQFAVRGAGSKRVGTAASTVPHQPAAARHGAGFRTETDPA